MNNISFSFLGNQKYIFKKNVSTTSLVEYFGDLLYSAISINDTVSAMVEPTVFVYYFQDPLCALCMESLYVKVSNQPLLIRVIIKLTHSDSVVCRKHDDDVQFPRAAILEKRNLF